MPENLIVEIILGLLTASIGAYAFISASRANKAQILTTKTTVDAQAYERAKGIYESALTALQGQTAQLGEEITGLRTEVARLRLQSVDLHAEVSRLRATNEDLRLQVMALREAAAREGE